MALEVFRRADQQKSPAIEIGSWRDRMTTVVTLSWVSEIRYFGVFSRRVGVSILRRLIRLYVYCPTFYTAAERREVALLGLLDLKAA